MTTKAIYRLSTDVGTIDNNVLQRIIDHNDIEITCAHGIDNHLLIGMNNGELELIVVGCDNVSNRHRAHDGSVVACALRDDYAASVGSDKVEFSF